MKEDAWIEEPAVNPFVLYLTYSLKWQVRLGRERIHGLWLTREGVTDPGLRQGLMKAGNEEGVR